MAARANYSTGWAILDGGQARLQAIERPGIGAGKIKNEQLFTDLLASAYDLQQRQDVIRSRLGSARFSEIIAEVINTQSLIRTHVLHSDTAMFLVANRAQKLSGAAGAAVGFLNGEELEYRAATGIAASLLGCKVAAARKGLPFSPVRLGELGESDGRQLAGRVAAKSVLTVPLYHDGKLDGCLQLFSRTGELGWQAKYVCELMSDVWSLHMASEGQSRRGDRDSRTDAVKRNLLLADAKVSGKAFPPVGPHKSDKNEAEQKRPSVDVDRHFNGGEMEQLPSVEELILELQQHGEENPVDSKPEPDLRHDSFDLLASKEPLIRQGKSKTASGSSANPPFWSEFGAVDARSDMGTAGQQVALARAKPPFFSTDCRERIASTRDGQRRKKIALYAQAAAYPCSVLAFAAVANAISGMRGWALEVATIVIVALTTLELRSRLGKL